MGVFSQSKQIFVDEKKRQDENKRQRKEKAAQEKFSVRLGRFLKRWGVRLFYTAFMGLIIYSSILACTVAIPSMMSVIIASMGFALDSVVEIVLAALSGLFFTGWVFVISYKLISKVGKIYLAKMKSTLSEDVIARFESLK